MSRRGRTAGILLLLLALALGHVAWWYWPRERAAAPDPASATARLLAAGDYDLCTWIPYPHQNLGALARATGDFPRVLAAATRLAGSSAPDELRTFGPFLVPPASELVACADLAGGRLRIAARVYPTLALVARLAGRLADNAWLAGGEVGRLRVDWQEGLWVVSAGEPGAAGEAGGGPTIGGGEGGAAGPGGRAAAGSGRNTAAGPGAAAAPSAGSALSNLPAGLALARLARPLRGLPAGTYVLRRMGADLDLERIEEGSGAAIPDLGPGPRPALLVASRAAGKTESGSGSSRDGRLGAPPPPAALALFAGTGETGTGQGGTGETGTGQRGTSETGTGQEETRTGQGGTGGASLDLRAELPGIALFHPAGGPARWGMPGGTLGRLLTGRLPRREATGWSIVALDEESLRQAVALAPRLAALMPPVPAPASTSPSGLPSANPATSRPPPGAAQTRPSPRLTLALWIEPGAAVAVVARVRRFLDGFPLTPRRQAQRWRDWETVLQPLAACRHGAVAAGADPPSFHLRLESCAAR
jgi:hypothetical protein